MESTNGMTSWAVDLKDVAAIYPFQCKRVWPTRASSFVGVLFVGRVLPAAPEQEGG